MACVIINMGSNLGDRRLMLSKAMRRVGLEFGPFEMSHAVESMPEGFDSANPFLNLAMIFNTDLQPAEVLRKLQEIEKELSDGPHRDETGGYIDRELDIDIMAVDDLIIDTPDLCIPHPRLAERRFFLEPLREIAPGWKHPVTGLTADDMLAKLPGGNGAE